MTLQSRAMTPSPATFEGTLDTLYAEYVEPNLPTPETVSYYHRLLVGYCRQKDPLFLLRKVRKMDVCSIYPTNTGYRIRATDNAPAWWMHFLTFHDTAFSSADFTKEVVNAPASMPEVRKRFPKSINSARWYVAHIFRVKNGDTNYAEWDRSELTHRFLKSIHPCNHFYMPNVKPQEYGEDKRVIAYFAGRYSARYADVWPEFLQCIGQIGFEAGNAVQDYGNLRITLSGPMPFVPEGTLTTYQYSRVCFLAKYIEPLAPDQEFRMETPDGVFRMSKAQFQRDFANVVSSKSYRDNKIYHTKTPMPAILRYRVLEADTLGTDEQMTEIL